MPEERRLTITSSPHLAPDDVARHTFASVRRGFDPTEVRDYLESIATGLRSHVQREQELLAAVADAEERAANPVIDDTMLTAAVGKETARVLQSAHDAASIALQERTAQQVAAALDKVRADAEELTERARAEGRSMVEEAQALRARVLADLSRRRKVLHAQIEQLRAGRERLAETVHDVKRSVEAIAEELFNAENEARLAAEAAGREVADRPDEGTAEELAALLLAEEATAATGPAEDATAPVAAAPVEVVDGAAEEVADDEELDVAEDTSIARPVEQVDALFAKLRAAQGGAADAQPASPGGSAALG